MDDWAEQRRRAVTAHAADLQRRRAAEADQACQLLDWFVRSARARGLPVVPLVARPYHGRARYRTGLRGWYLDQDGTMAVDLDGAFYLLRVRRTLLGRITGVSLRPHRPGLVIGEGGRDGESIPLRRLLQHRLDSA